MHGFTNILHYNNEQKHGKKSQSTDQEWIISAWGQNWPHSVVCVTKITR